MRLYQKLVLFVLAAAAAPVALIGFALLGRAERELEGRIAAQQQAAASALANEFSLRVDEAVESLARAADPIHWRELDAEERAGALQLLLRQSRHFAAAALLDAAGGEIVPAQSAAEDGKAALDAPALAAFRAAVPVKGLAGAAPGAVALSPAYARGPNWACALAVTIGGEGQGTWIAAVELSLAALQARAREVSRGELGALLLVDGEGRVLAGPDAVAPPLTPGDRALIGAAATGSAVAHYRVDDAAVLAAAARTPDRLGWSVLVRLPQAKAFAPVERLRRTILVVLGAGLALLLLGGFVFTRRIARGLERLAGGARAYARGELTARVAIAGGDEIAELAQTFNAMGGELAAARGRLERWNEDLQREVEQRTAELRLAQAQLLEAQKLAAIGQLGAGVAHELNTPLAGILGGAQLLLQDRADDDPANDVLKRIEAQAVRAKEITANLLRFSQQQPAAHARAVDLNRTVQEALSLVETQVRAEGVELQLALAEPAPVAHGDSGHLAQVLLNLVSNARAAMLKSPERRLTISTFAAGETVGFEVADTGRGIADKDLPHIFEPFFTTKTVWSNVGLGLSVSYRIVSEHGGKIAVATTPGTGSRFRVELPAVVKPVSQGGGRAIAS